MRANGFSMSIILIALAGPSCERRGGSGDDSQDASGQDVAGQDLPDAPLRTEDHTPPTVSFKSPVAAQDLSGVVDVTVDAADNVGVARVAYALNSTLQSESTAAPAFGWTWETALFENGNYVLSAVASDDAGNVSEPATVEVTVANAASATCAPPKVNIVYPTDGAEVCGEVALQAAVSGACEITLIELFIDEKKVGEATKAPYELTWSTNAFSDGPHTLRISATDSEKQKTHQLK